MMMPMPIMMPMQQQMPASSAPAQASRNVAMFGNVPVGESIAGNSNPGTRGDLKGKVRPSFTVSAVTVLGVLTAGTLINFSVPRERAGDHDLWLQGRADQRRRVEHRSLWHPRKRWPWR
jgi:hypothetical protein